MCKKMFREGVTESGVFYETSYKIIFFTLFKFSVN